MTDRAGRRRRPPSKPLESARPRAPRGAALARPPHGDDGPQPLDGRVARRRTQYSRASRSSRRPTPQPRRPPLPRRRTRPARARDRRRTPRSTPSPSPRSASTAASPPASASRSTTCPRPTRPPSSWHPPSTRWRAGDLRDARFVGVGLAVPGLVRASDGLVRFAPHLLWSDVPIRALVEAATGLPTAVGNDASLGAIAEHLFGAGRGVDDMVYLNGGASGIGGGLIVHGQAGRRIGGLRRRVRPEPAGNRRHRRSTRRRRRARGRGEPRPTARGRRARPR